MAEKIFDKKYLEELGKGELRKEKRATEREIQKQRQLLEKFGYHDKYYNLRNKHLSLLYRKKRYIDRLTKES